MSSNLKNPKQSSNEDKKSSKPASGTLEWASSNANFINGCMHDCKYCYAKSMAIRFKRKTSDNWKVEEVNNSKVNKKFRKRKGRIMFPSTHDITPQNKDYCLNFLQNLLLAGNDILIVTKPHLDVVEEICENFTAYKDNILFRFTIGSCDTATLKFWEPNAPSFEERFSSLKWAYHNGFNTSVSSEPLLETNIFQLAETLLPYVTDAMWIGKPNRLKQILKQNGITDRETINKAKELMASLSDEWILELYDFYKDNTMVKWKESIKKVVGLNRPSKKGLDV